MNRRVIYQQILLKIIIVVRIRDTDFSVRFGLFLHSLWKKESVSLGSSSIEHMLQYIYIWTQPGRNIPKVNNSITKTLRNGCSADPEVRKTLGNVQGQGDLKVYTFTLCIFL